MTYGKRGRPPDCSVALPSELHRIAGVDLTDILSVSAVTVQVILTEIGPVS
jgi:hypothetical protein